MGRIPDDWNRVKDLFEAALEMGPPERPAFLAKECADENLRQQVENLLANFQQAGSFLEEPVLNPKIAIPEDPSKSGEQEFPGGEAKSSDPFATAPSAEVQDSMVGRRLGVYKLIRRVGQGGMAAVYLAARADDEYHKIVAVKLVQLGLDSHNLLSRFRSERQTLAGLDHPNIVRLLDGGSTSEGLPFLVMDYVEGCRIDDYCDQRKLCVDARLDVFSKVFEAVQYAHQKGIIHRDLKPGNILVTADGTPKLLDFGIAKVLNAEPSSQMFQATQTGTRCMTPAYASPEQMQGKSITAATDIYSLGVVLYELLCGHRPYRLAQRTPAEIERAICEQDPETPSTAVNRVETDTSADGVPITKTPGQVSQTREGQPDKLRRRLRGDLDNIVLKALQKVPEKRYGSVEEFSADIQRHLRHLPIKARPNTLAYRISKFAQRHSAQVVAALALLTVSAIFWCFEHPQRPSRTPSEPRLKGLTFNSFENPVNSGAISPDGKYLAYADTNGMYLQLVASGETHRIPEPEGVKRKELEWQILPTGWFPDSVRFVANSHSRPELVGSGSEHTTIWMVSALGGGPQKLRSHAVAWSVSPDGSSIAIGTNQDHFFRGDSFGEREIWLMSPTGEIQRKLFNVGEKTALSGFAWAPDGRHASYLKTEESGNSLLLRDQNNGTAVTIFPPSETKWMGDILWLRDGRLLYTLVESDVRGTCNYWTVRLDLHTGQHVERPRRLTNFNGPCVLRPSVTADGEKIIFLRVSQRITSYMAELTAGGTRLLNLRHFPTSESSDLFGNWSPDSKALIFESERTGRCAFYKQPLDSDIPEGPLVTPPNPGYDPWFTPDGKRILYVGLPQDVRGQAPVVSVPIEGGPARQLFVERGWGRITCGLLPSAGCVIGEPTEDRKWAIISAIDPLKGRGRELARFDLDPEKGHWEIALSPDGTRIAAIRTQDGPIYILSLRGEAPQQIRVKGWSNLWQLNWAADGKGLFVSSGIAFARILLHVDLQGNAHLLSRDPAWFADKVGYPSPDGRHLAWSSFSFDGNMWMMENF